MGSTQTRKMVSMSSNPSQQAGSMLRHMCLICKLMPQHDLGSIHGSSTTGSSGAHPALQRSEHRSHRGSALKGAIRCGPVSLGQAQHGGRGL